MRINMRKNRLMITTEQNDISISDLVVFGYRTYAVSISNHGVRYFNTIAEALDFISGSGYLSNDESEELLEALQPKF